MISCINNNLNDKKTIWLDRILYYSFNSKRFTDVPCFTTNLFKPDSSYILTEASHNENDKTLQLLQIRQPSYRNCYLMSQEQSNEYFDNFTVNLILSIRKWLIVLDKQYHVDINDIRAIQPMLTFKSSFYQYIIKKDAQYDHKTIKHLIILMSDWINIQKKWNSNYRDEIELSLELKKCATELIKKTHELTREISSKISFYKLKKPFQSGIEFYKWYAINILKWSNYENDDSLIDPCDPFYKIFSKKNQPLCLLVDKAKQQGKLKSWSTPLLDFLFYVAMQIWLTYNGFILEYIGSKEDKIYDMSYPKYQYIFAEFFNFSIQLDHLSFIQKQFNINEYENSSNKYKLIEIAGELPFIHYALIFICYYREKIIQYDETFKSKELEIYNLLHHWISSKSIKLNQQNFETNIIKDVNNVITKAISLTTEANIESRNKFYEAPIHVNSNNNNITYSHFRADYWKYSIRVYVNPKIDDELNKIIKTQNKQIKENLLLSSSSNQHKFTPNIYLYLNRLNVQSALRIETLTHIHFQYNKPILTDEDIQKLTEDTKILHFISRPLNISRCCYMYIRNNEKNQAIYYKPGYFYQMIIFPFHLSSISTKLTDQFSFENVSLNLIGPQYLELETFDWMIDVYINEIISCWTYITGKIKEVQQINDSCLMYYKNFGILNNDVNILINDYLNFNDIIIESFKPFNNNNNNLIIPENLYQKPNIDIAIYYEFLASLVEDEYQLFIMLYNRYSGHLNYNDKEVEKVWKELKESYFALYNKAIKTLRKYNQTDPRFEHSLCSFMLSFATSETRIINFKDVINGLNTFINTNHIIAEWLNSKKSCIHLQAKLKNSNNEWKKCNLNEFKNVINIIDIYHSAILNQTFQNNNFPSNNQYDFRWILIDDKNNIIENNDNTQYLYKEQINLTKTIIKQTIIKYWRILFPNQCIEYLNWSESNKPFSYKKNKWFKEWINEFQFSTLCFENFYNANIIGKSVQLKWLEEFKELSSLCTQSDVISKLLKLDITELTLLYNKILGALILLNVKEPNLLKTIIDENHQLYCNKINQQTELLLNYQTNESPRPTKKQRKSGLAKTQKIADPPKQLTKNDWNLILFIFDKLRIVLHIISENSTMELVNKNQFLLASLNISENSSRLQYETKQLILNKLTNSDELFMNFKLTFNHIDFFVKKFTEKYKQINYEYFPLDWLKYIINNIINILEEERQILTSWQQCQLLTTLFFRIINGLRCIKDKELFLFQTFISTLKDNNEQLELLNYCQNIKDLIASIIKPGNIIADLSYEKWKILNTILLALPINRYQSDRIFSNWQEIDNSFSFYNHTIYPAPKCLKLFQNVSNDIGLLMICLFIYYFEHNKDSIRYIREKLNENSNNNNQTRLQNISNNCGLLFNEIINNPDFINSLQK